MQNLQKSLQKLRTQSLYRFIVTEMLYIECIQMYRDVKYMLYIYFLS